MLQNSIFKVCKCFNIFYTIFTQVLDKIENFEFPKNAQCLLSASLKAFMSKVASELGVPITSNKSDHQFQSFVSDVCFQQRKGRLGID